MSKENEENIAWLQKNTADSCCTDMNLRFTYISPSIMRAMIHCWGAMIYPRPVHNSRIHANLADGFWRRDEIRSLCPPTRENPHHGVWRIQKRMDPSSVWRTAFQLSATRKTRWSGYSREPDITNRKQRKEINEQRRKIPHAGRIQPSCKDASGTLDLCESCGCGNFRLHEEDSTACTSGSVHPDHGHGKNKAVTSSTGK